MEKKIKFVNNIENAKLSISDLLSMHDAVYSYFQDKWTKADLNERRWMGKNWTANQETEIKNQDRYPYSIPLVASKLKIISSLQRQSRTMFKIEAASDPQDEIKAELATLGIRDIERQSKFPEIEGDIYDSGLGVCFGASKLVLDHSGYYPQIRILKKDYKELVWDINSKQYDVNDDALWMCDIEKIPRYILNKLEGIDADDLNEGTTGTFEGRETTSYYVNKYFSDNPDFDMITIFNHYQKVVRKYYCVIFPDTEGLYNFNSQIVGKYKTEKEAEQKLRELNIPYLTSETFEPHWEGTVIDKDELRLDRYKFTYNKMLEYEETELEKFPYNLFFAMRFENEFVSFMDFLQDLQIIFDRYWAQLDYAMGKDLKKVYELFLGGLADEETQESASRKMNKTGGVLFKKIPAQIIQEFQGKGVNPQFFQVAEIIMSLIEDLMGGRSFQGLSEGSNESGVSIREKKAQGLLIAYIFSDNLSRYKRALGENILWWMQHFDTAERTIKVHGSALTPEMLELLQKNNIYTSNIRNDGGGYVRINAEDNPLTYLSDAEFELVITEAELADFEKDAKMLQLLAAEKQDPLLMQSPTFQRLKLESMKIDFSDRQKIIQEREQAMQAQAQAAQEEQNMRKAELLMKMPGREQNKQDKEQQE